MQTQFSQFPDTQLFIKSLETLRTRLPVWQDDFLSADCERTVTRAPGRLDVMGGIADYSGSLVLQLPIASAAHVALQKNNSNSLRLVSLPFSDTGDLRTFEIRLSDFSSGGTPIAYVTARDRFAAHSADHWAAYVAGAVLVLMREENVVFSEGVDILISSAVPEGKGVSSSAALEVATMNAVVAAFKIEVSPVQLALLCQKVENMVAGAACGVMDQMTAECGEVDRLLRLRCQPCEFLGTLAIPSHLEFWGLDSGKRHAVGGSDYTIVRTAAFMGYRMIAELARFPVNINQDGKVHIDDPRWNGYLANIEPEVFENQFAPHLPALISGKQFLEKYCGTTDSVTTVDPEVKYPVLQATQHPVYENDRVQSFAKLLRELPDANLLGDLMFGSHQSYSRCGLGSPETDLIVDLVRDSTEDLYGARITGGGCGGTVAILGRRGNLAAIERVAREYEKQTGNKATIVSGSSPGASTFQHLKLMSDRL